MALNIGNQFDYGRDQIDYGKVPLWDSVTQQYPSGASIVGTAEGKEGNGIPKIGELIPAGTPVEIKYLGDTEPKLADKATNPTGLTRYDATVTKDGCTLTIVTEGVIYADRYLGKAATDVETKLGARIKFVHEIKDNDGKYGQSTD